MNHRIFLCSVATAALSAVGALPLAAQSSAAAKASDKVAVESSTTSGNYVAPKTPWHVPDLQGTWTSDDTWGVPFQRPKKFGTRATLTEDELKEREKGIQRSEEFVETGGENHSPAVAELEAKEKGEPAPQPKGRFGRGVDAAPVPGHWGEFARRASDQTSQVVFPLDGQIPALTPEAQAELTAKMKLRRDPDPASYTNWSYYDRCITRGVAGSILPVIYGNGLEIVQTPGYVAIRYEMVHDVRIIPTDGRPHLSSNIRSYMGDAVGHWEGNTLVVETTNLLGGRMAIGANGDMGAPYSADMKLTERFTRVAPNRINYELTVDDPKTYTGIWKVAFPITHEPGYKLFEYACHEGNMAMHDMLSAARMEDAKKAAQAAQGK
ncbi:MAG TPA: hypothetical protein VME17_17145 [Bryobacteraceae bacterium]|nr:hypothetical protein [Bryobacteraceae bacterium]